MNLNAPLAGIKLISPAYQKRFLKLGLKTLKDLFYHFPHRYNDFSGIILIRDIRIGETATIQGQITEIRNTRSWKKRINITEAHVMDKSGILKAVWYHQPFLIKNLRPGDVISLSGKVNFNKVCFLSNPAYEKIAGGSASGGQPTAKNRLRHTGRLVPVYPETAGLTSRYFRYIINIFLPTISLAKDWLPQEIKDNQQLVNLDLALRQIHFPDDKKILEQAKRRLGFDELFLIQLNLLRQRLKWESRKTVEIPFSEPLIKKFVAGLPFSLTDAQRKSAWEIFMDLQKNRPMNRLLQGDVGSGKTVVAGLAMLQTVAAGAQAALMAPTEILADQHFATLRNLFSGYDFKIGLLTGVRSAEARLGEMKKNNRAEMLAKIAGGEIKILVGTQALIQKKVEFNNLALAVVDEQHRFGVAQREALQQNIARIKDESPSAVPHLLSMTATPIPRTLALAVYGDLDISLINEMPAGRQKIITKIIPPAGRTGAYEFIRRQIIEGRQVFVICPRIEAADDSGAIAEGNRLAGIIDIKNEIRSVTQEYEKLSRKIFPGFKVAMLHGRLKTKDKQKVMADFVKGKTNILVSTSVVEVGVDVPNATVMMIEGSERFGLAQLHQFRGRVGRGGHQSYCFLFADSDLTAVRSRLEALSQAKNGFELAEKDLEIRGPGEFYGARQWGLPDLAMASLSDVWLIKQARQEAVKLLKKDAGLKNYPLLGEQLKKFQMSIHLE